MPDDNANIFDSIINEDNPIAELLRSTPPPRVPLEEKPTSAAPATPVIPTTQAAPVTSTTPQASPPALGTGGVVPGQPVRQPILNVAQPQEVPTMAFNILEQFVRPTVYHPYSTNDLRLYNVHGLWAIDDKDIRTPVASLSFLRQGFVPSNWSGTDYNISYINPRVRSDSFSRSMLMEEKEMSNRRDRLAILYPFVDNLIDVYKKDYGIEFYKSPQILGPEIFGATEGVDVPRFGTFVARIALGDSPLVDPKESFMPIPKWNEDGTISYPTGDQLTVNKVYRYLINTLNNYAKELISSGNQDLIGNMNSPEGMMGPRELFTNTAMMATSASILRHLYLFGPINMPAVIKDSNFLSKMIECLDNDYKYPIRKGRSYESAYDPSGQVFYPNKFAKLSNPMIAAGRPNGEMFMVTKSTSHSMIPTWLDPNLYANAIVEAFDYYQKHKDNPNADPYAAIRNLSFYFTNDTTSLYTGTQYLNYRALGYQPGSDDAKTRDLVEKFAYYRDYNLKLAYLLTQAGTLFEVYGNPQAKTVSELAQYDREIQHGKKVSSSRDIYNNEGSAVVKTYAIASPKSNLYKVYSTLPLRSLANYHMEMARHYETLRYIFSGGRVPILNPQVTRQGNKLIITGTHRDPTEEERARERILAKNVERILFMNTMANAAGVAREDLFIPIAFDNLESLRSRNFFTNMPKLFSNGLKVTLSQTTNPFLAGAWNIGATVFSALTAGFINPGLAQATPTSLRRVRDNLLSWRDNIHRKTNSQIVNEVFKELYPDMGIGFDEFINMELR